MSIEWRSGLLVRAQVHAALSEPARLAIVDRLTMSDASPAEIGGDLGIPSNLLAHHVKVLQRAGVVAKSRSEGDHRRMYLRLRPAALMRLAPSNVLHTARVVFVCTRNSARSQLAAALWARNGHVAATSGGTHPAARVHPEAVAVARREGLSLSAERTTHIDDVLRDDDLVISVCDNAHEELGARIGDRLHWSIPDPARSDTDDAFDRAFRDIADRVDRLSPVVRPLES